MPKSKFQVWAVMAAAVILAGCASAPREGESTGVTTRAYIDDKARIDQNMEGGNYGYLQGTPKPEDRSNFKKTRQVYVVEFTKEVPQPPDPPRPVRPTHSDYTSSTKSAPAEPDWAKPVRLPRLDDMDADSRQDAAEDSDDKSSSKFVDYTVEKNDTLQKISKKFYNSYKKWPRIVEANKDTLKDPNKIRPGMKLRVPVE